MTDAARAADGGQDLPVPVTSPASAPTAEDPFPAPRRSSDLADPTRAFNREISWVDFNDRVLQLAESPPEEQPLMERLKFCSIYSSNQDEFFMVRVAGLLDQVDAGIEKMRGGLTPSTTLDALHEKIEPQVQRQARLWQDRLMPELATHGIRIVGLADLSEDQRREIDDRFRKQVLPVLTPLAVGLGRPFPYISNLSL
ncbi:MAG: RNA degradosome polyphosphate kinase, partial [Solirubrobacterales bacterium]